MTGNDKGEIPEFHNDLEDSLMAFTAGSSLQATPSSSAALKRAASASDVCSKITAGRRPAFDSVLCYVGKQ